jgi:hypothetical protein
MVLFRPRFLTSSRDVLQLRGCGVTGGAGLAAEFQVARGSLRAAALGTARAETRENGAKRRKCERVIDPRESTPAIRMRGLSTLVQKSNAPTRSSGLYSTLVYFRYCMRRLGAT